LRNTTASLNEARKNIKRNLSTEEGPRKYLATQRLDSIPLQTVWTEFTPLAQQHKAVNLGQGFPDFPAEDWLLKETSSAVEENIVQYARSPGHVRLVNALATTYSKRINRQIDPLKEIVVTVGATEALFVAMQAIVKPGDEVILIEPFYDSYPHCVQVAGGKCVYVPLRPAPDSKSSADWKLDMNELEKAISKKTKAILINTPQNVPGKVYTRAELEGIAALAKKHDFLVIMDQVYEWMVYAPEYPRIATFPDMFDRCISIGSAGKSFSVTGYKVGWAIGPAWFVEAMFKIHQQLTFSVATPMQEGIARALEQADSRNYWSNLHEMFLKKRELLVGLLQQSGLKTVVPEGSYFVLADTSSVPDRLFYDKASTVPRDWQLCRWLTRDIGVAAIPPSAFYSTEHQSLAANFARFAFCKKDETIRAGGERLKQNLKPLLK
jgi:aspartate/methionine/tyrosine aminotransferase